MRVVLICRSFDKNSGQGIYKMAAYLFESLKKYSKFQIEKIESRRENLYYFDLIKCPKKLLNSDFDIYHFLIPESSLPILISEKIRKNSIVTIHDTIVYKIKERKWPSEIYIKLMSNIARRARMIITPSKESKNDIIKFLKIPQNKIQILPWGIDLNVFKPKKRKRGKNKLMIGYLGGLGKRKNVEWLLFLAKEFCDNTIFRIAGIGCRLPKLLQIKKELKLNNVEFVGFVKEEKLSKFYNSLDVFIFPSFYEGFGIPLIEAMACEVPYIIGTNAGIGEILPIYKISNFEELKEVLLKIKSGELKPLKNQRKWIIKNKLTWKEHVKKLVKIYEEIA